ncbi:hypothetical protein, partial [Methanosarcina mazei]|uniref:hypothetical protein n=1 Tax=Methanosarcina mazei TaxID=2209 RepID=UPI001910B86B
PIPDYYDFPNGFIAFSNIRMIKDLNGLQVYVPDVEKYVMAPIKEKADELLSEQLAWINEDDLLDEYGVYLKKDNTGMIVSNSVGIGFVSDEDQFSY